jgi:monoterpene epsilon-lactone hydrolase
MAITGNNFFLLFTFTSLIFTAGPAGARKQSTDAPSMPVPQDISAEARAYYENLRPRSTKPLDIRNPKVLAFTRKFLSDIFLSNAEELGIEYKLERVDVIGAEAYWIRAGQQTDDKVLLYFHGGGQILGSAKTNLATPLRVAQHSDIPIITIEYRLAPEHPFPAGLNDGLTVYRWLLKNGYSHEDIGVFGDSAGGNLALTMPLLARDEGLPQPAAIVLLSPSVDRTRTGDTHTTLVKFDPVLGAPSIEVYAGDYPVDHPLISPVYADLTGLPPILIQVGTRERLLSDSVRLARRSRVAGVDVTLDVWDGMWHVWQDNPSIPEADLATREIGLFFRQHLSVN